MRPLSFLLRDKPLPVLAREAVWRAQRAILKRRRMAEIDRDHSHISFRNIPYYRPEVVQCSPSATGTIIRAANLVLSGSFPLLGYDAAQLGFPPCWDSDFVAGKTWPMVPAEQLTVVRHDGSDVKVPWELSRLQYAPVFAKAYVLTGEEKYREGARRLLLDWIEKNPPCGGVNWAVAMEAALRAISMCFTLNLLWPLRADEQRWLDNVQRSLWQHLLFIEGNLEFSNIACGNHYLSNVVGLLVLSQFLDGRPVLPRRRRYLRMLEAEMQRQVYADGGNFEASSGYHLLVLQMFAAAELVMRAAGVASSSAYQQRLRAMFAYIAALCDEQGRAPQFGDCDDGRVFLTVDDLERLMRHAPDRDAMRCTSMLGLGAAMFGLPNAYLQEEAAWYGLPRPPLSETAGQPRVQVFENSGVAVARIGTATVMFLNMPNGIAGKGSHTHNDKLSVVMQLFGEDLLIDSGTGVYTRDAALRNSLRTTASHNTVQIDGREQNNINTSKQFLFCLGDEALVAPILSEDDRQTVTLRSALRRCSVPGVEHHRTVMLAMKPGGIGARLRIEDRLLGDGEHDFTVFWNIGPHWKTTDLQTSGDCLSLAIAGPSIVHLRTMAPCRLKGARMPAQVSYSYGVLLNSERIAISGRSRFPVTICTELTWSEQSSLAQ